MDKVANDFKMPCRTPSEQKAVFDTVMDMTSWMNKGCCPKTSRWFSWVEASHEQLREFWGSNMILEAYLRHHGLDDVMMMMMMMMMMLKMKTHLTLKSISRN